MSKAHERVVEIVFTAANGAQTVTVNGLNYYRDRGQLLAATPQKLVFTPSGSAQAVALPPEIVLGELLPPPTHIRLTATVTA